MIHYSMGNEPVGVVHSSLQDIRAPLFSWEWPCQFYTILHTSSVLATVPSWIAVFFFWKALSVVVDLSVLVLAGIFR